MQDTGYRAIAVVGVGAVLPDAPNAAAFWKNVTSGRDSITEVTPDRWDSALYYDADHSAPDKTYSKIGGWVRECAWDPLASHLPLPPRVADAMDDSHKWTIVSVREALADYGYPDRPFNTDRTAVILGNAMGGEQHYLTSLRAYFPEYARELQESATFAALPEAMRRDITRELHQRIGRRLPPITEDSMPGELANCLAGRVANLFNFRGPNFSCDAACASAMAATRSAMEGLVENDFDVAITGGADRNMGPSTFVKFCKIGALSATGSRPYAEGADGFVMGEGTAVFILKRLADAERDGDRIYAVLRAMGASSDGKGKGITAPNPIGQKLCLERAWQNAGLSPATATLIEGHGTSTSVGDLVEMESLAKLLKEHGAAPGSVALGSVKSNIGHLKGAAGAAGILKATLALHHKLMPPSIHCDHPNPGIDFSSAPLYVNRELTPWNPVRDGVRRVGVSAFGFGGTNFHAVLEEYVPHRLTGNGKRPVAASEAPPAGRGPERKVPLRGALVVGAANVSELAERLRSAERAASAGQAPPAALPAPTDLRAAERIAIDYASAAELAEKAGKALKALTGPEGHPQPAVWKALRAQGIFRGRGPAGKVAFLYTGQGSQYVNMLRDLRAAEPIIAETFAEADRVMTPVLGKPLSEFVFVERNDPDAVAQAEEDLRQTAITQPAVLAVDLGLTKLLAAYGIEPDMTMGHSLGEYGALVAAGALPFEDALEAVAARGREMTRVSWADNGRMAAVFAPLAEIARILKTISGYVVVANINSERQAVIGGASKAVENAVEAFRKAGYDVTPLPVSHAFHTSIVAPASEPLRNVLERLRLAPPRVPVVANVDGQFYPNGPGAVPKMLDILARQIAAPVQFVQGLRTLHEAGVRVFVEVGPKKALQGFADEMFGDRPDVFSLFTNHPKFGDLVAFNQALCGLYAAGLGAPAEAAAVQPVQTAEPPRGAARPVVITGAALGLPGNGRIFDDRNVARILDGEQLIDVIPGRFRNAILEKRITRLVKTDNGGPVFEPITKVSDVIKLAGRGGEFNLGAEFGIPADRIAALDRTTALAIAAGIDALRDAGIPLVLRYKNTTKGTRLPDRWCLPDELRDSTGVIFASAFPGYDSFADETARYYRDRSRREQVAMLQSLRARAVNGDSVVGQEIDRRIREIEKALAQEPYSFDRRFVFRTLPMGHSQFAELVGARGPNTALNAACASTTQALAVAQDWIRAGRCRRVIVVSGDDITSDHMMEWFGAAFLASGAAATDEVVEEAALPFDRRRHGMITGMGAAALVVESEEAAAERGLRPICEVVGAVTANSAYHGTRLDIDHIHRVMEEVVREAEKNTGVPRAQLAQSMVFVSHETYTPARGGSASAEINALRRVFGADADKIVIANTKGFTGHAMAAGIEDVVAVKALETGCVPPVANFKEVDPELGPLNLSKGGLYRVNYALRLGAGFGSQISMTLLRRVFAQAARPAPSELGYAYRVVDGGAWSAWTARIAGGPAELEVAQRTLRVRDRGAATQTAPPPQVEQVVSLAPVPSAPPVAQLAPPPAAAPVVQQAVLALVAEKTGYPVEMLDLDLDLEADLGIDTVKQAEVFAAIREAYGIPRDDKLRLRDFPTLAHVIQFVYDRRPDLKAAATAEAAPARSAVERTPPAPAAAPAAAAPDLEGRILALVVEKTGYPKDMLDLELDLEADLGIDTVKQAEIFASIREMFDIPRDPNLKLRDFPTLAHVIQFARERAETIPAPAAVATEPVSAPPQPQAPAADSIQEQVLAIVAEKTGYPREMLDLDLDLEADLGIDTVKQAEMFASVRAAFNIERDPNLKLRDFPTLAHVIRFARGQSGAIPAPTAVVPEPVSAPPQPQAPAADSIQERVLAIVAEKTGYPKEMLDLDLDLEADLGIDTVKQAEMFASVRAAFNIERDPNLKLRDFPTLAHVIQFATDRQGGAGLATPPGPAVETAPAPPTPAPALRGFEAAEAIPRRVPVPQVRPPLACSKPTGVTLAAGSRVAIMPDQGGTGDALAEQLRGMGVEAVSIDEAIASGRVDGVFWLPALDPEGDLAAMDPAEWREATRTRVKALYEAMRALYEQIASPNTFLVSATRLGGLHGYEDAGAFAPLGGGVTGFTKAYKRERPDALVKAVDFGPEMASADVARLLIEETLQDPGTVEIGYRDGLRWTIGVEEQLLSGTGLTLDRNSVFVVTGAAGSIVSAITADLATASGGTFYLLDVAPEPDPANPDFERFTNDKDGLKRELFARIQASGLRATPALVEKEIAALERGQAALTAIRAVRDAGGTAHYLSLDLRDADAVSAAIGRIRDETGRIDVLLHAAGLERSHFLPAKEPAEFDLVFDVKAGGWFNLMRAIDDMPVGAVVMFSSVAGRFGNAGQADYSAANDLLCKVVSSFRATRPATHALAIDWTAWGGIGMATRGSIPKVMEAAGIEMLPPEAGIPWIRRELTAGSGSGEVVVGGKLGILGEPWDSTGGIDASVELDRPMLGRVGRVDSSGEIVIETTLDPKVQPFLFDHQIEDTPVLPGVMGIEAFAEAALWLAPGWHIATIEDVDFAAPFKFYRGEPRALEVRAVLHKAEDGLLADCRLIGRRLLPNLTEPQTTIHFRARVRLTRFHPESVRAHALELGIGSLIEAADVYRIYFHGPAYQVVKQAWWSGERMVAEMAANLPPNHHPPDQALAAAPRLIELCFQSAGLIEMAAGHRMGLPRHLDRLWVSPEPVPENEPLYAVVTAGRKPAGDAAGESFDAEVVDRDGRRYIQIGGYRTVTFRENAGADLLRPVTAGTAD
jgi:acyl transferase domain-containing protein/NAD(P)-dependent dehydrogenase (short-subunit alcohol dehydrogenase family)/acyl carrier protein